MPGNYTINMQKLSIERPFDMKKHAAQPGGVWEILNNAYRLNATQ